MALLGVGRGRQRPKFVAYRAHHMIIVALTLHLLAALLWVGGMFFAYVVLRPSAAALAPEIRLSLWSRVFARFFAWVWLSVATLLCSGIALVLLAYGGFTALSVYVRAMMASGLAMMALYTYVYFVPWRGLRAAVAAAAWAEAGKHLNQIRRLVAVNLILGVVTVTVGVAGLYR